VWFLAGGCNAQSTRSCLSRGKSPRGVKGYEYCVRVQFGAQVVLKRSRVGPSSSGVPGVLRMLVNSHRLKEYSLTVLFVYIVCQFCDEQQLGSHEMMSTQIFRGFPNDLP
jgi:hypothetical protein